MQLPSMTSPLKIKGKKGLKKATTTAKDETGEKKSKAKGTGASGHQKVRKARLF